MRMNKLYNIQLKVSGEGSLSLSVILHLIISALMLRGPERVGNSPGDTMIRVTIIRARRIVILNFAPA